MIQPSHFRNLQVSTPRASAVKAAVLLVLLAVLLTTALPGTASAGHWHSYANCSTGVEHALTHGSSTSDGSFFGRVAPADCGYYKICAGAETRWGTHTPLAEAWGVSSLCSAWFSTGGLIESWCGAGYAAAISSHDTQIISPHYHYSHNHNQTSCDTINQA